MLTQASWVSGRKEWVEVGGLEIEFKVKGGCKTKDSVSKNDLFEVYKIEFSKCTVLTFKKKFGEMEGSFRARGRI
jgi:hypothetical protein